MARSLIPLLAVVVIIVPRSDAFSCAPFEPQAQDCEGLKSFWTHVGEGELEVPSESMHYCDLSWVGCDADNIHVTSIDVRNQGLSGELPTCEGKASPCYDLDSLVKLQYLLLSNNEFTGIIPQTLVDLTELKTLSLSGNTFTGEIPVWFNAFTKLQQLDLSENQLSGVINCSAFDGLVNLNKIGLSANQFTGTLPECFGHLYNLQDLNMRDNQFTSWSTVHNPKRKSICTLFPEHPRRFGRLTGCDLANNPLVCGMPQCAEICGINPRTDCDHEDEF